MLGSARLVRAGKSFQPGKQPRNHTGPRNGRGRKSCPPRRQWPRIRNARPSRQVVEPQCPRSGLTTRSSWWSRARETGAAGCSARTALPEPATQASAAHGRSGPALAASPDGGAQAGRSRHGWAPAQRVCARQAPARQAAAGPPAERRDAAGAVERRRPALRPGAQPGAAAEVRRASVSQGRPASARASRRWAAPWGPAASERPLWAAPS
jgi:hypothetical protein